jgi:hypothetical protein
LSGIQAADHRPTLGAGTVDVERQQSGDALAATLRQSCERRETCYTVCTLRLRHRHTCGASFAAVPNRNAITGAFP